MIPQEGQTETDIKNTDTCETDKHMINTELIIFIQFQEVTKVDSF